MYGVDVKVLNRRATIFVSVQCLFRSENDLGGGLKIIYKEVSFWWKSIILKSVEQVTTFDLEKTIK